MRMLSRCAIVAISSRRPRHILIHIMQCIKVNPTWAKGYARKGAALHGSKKYDEAIAAYEEGLKLEDSSLLRKGLQEVKDAKGALDLDGSHFSY